MTLILRTTKATCRAFAYHPPAPILETLLLQRVVGISATASTALRISTAVLIIRRM